MGFLDQLKAAAAPKPATHVEELTAAVAEAERAEQSGLAAYREALAESARAGAVASALAPVAKARKVHAEAAEHLAALRDALEAARSAERGAARIAQRAAKAKAWDQAIARAQDRLQAAENLQHAATAYAAALAALKQATAAVVHALPDPSGDLAAARVRWPDVEKSARLDLLRNGVHWADAFPWGVSSMPAFLPQFAESVEVVRAWKHSALAALDEDRAHG